MRSRLILFIILVGVFATTCFPQSHKTTVTEVIVVFDNSGSMRTNDPEFKFRKSILSFIDTLSISSRVGFVLFDNEPRILKQLTLIAGTKRREFVNSVSNAINYSGNYTNIPDAIERAIYEFKINGTANVNKMLVFVTDGIIDLGDPSLNQEKKNWLKKDLIQEAVKLGIKIYSIAFTEKADFELIQSLGVQTGGNYYRALKVDEVPSILAALINAASNFEKIEKGNKSDQNSANVSRVADGFSTIIYLVAGFVAVGVVMIFYLLAKRKTSSTEVSQLVQIPEASLELISLKEGMINQIYQINRKVTKIGRGENNDISIPSEGVSSFHATIDYSDGVFYLVDQDSLNGTFKDEEKLTRYERIPIKSGNVLRFAKHKFIFKCENEGAVGQTILVDDLDIPKRETILIDDINNSNEISDYAPDSNSIDFADNSIDSGSEAADCGDGTIVKK